MAGNKFDPNDFMRKSKEPAEPKLPEIPERADNGISTTAPVVEAPAPNIVKDSGASRPTIKMLESISLTYEPEWERVLHELGITHN